VAIGPKTLRLAAGLRVKVGGEADAVTRSLTAAWARAWDVLARELQAAILDILATARETGVWPRPWELSRVARLQAALEAAQTSLVALARRAGVEVTDGAGRAITATVDAEPHLIASQLPAAEQVAAATRYAAKILPSHLDVIVARTQGAIVAQTSALPAAAMESMRSALIRGVAVGTNPGVAARQMLDGVEGAFTGGLTRAIVIARTEILDAYRVTSQYAHAANADVLEGWVWLATLDRRVCVSCLAQNGSEHPVTDPGPLDHQQGRCARVPLAKSWAALGLPGVEPASTMPDARAWFAKQPDATQLEIMGPSRLAMLRSGQATWDDLSTRRTAPGWRPSYAPTPVKDLITTG
jgi:hypothetical protein